jgi:hypothetical protein
MPDEIIEDWHGKVTNNPATHEVPVTARQQVLQKLFTMRYGAGIYIRNDYEFVTTSTEENFLTSIATWLEGFNTKLIVISDTTQEMSSELDELRRQQQAVRDFLGLTTWKEGITRA